MSDLSAFVVTADEGDKIRVPDFESQKKKKCLNTVEPSVYEISKEEIAHFGHISSVFEEFEEIVKLAMNIATNGDRGVYSLHVAFFDKYFFGFGA